MKVHLEKKHTKNWQKLQGGKHSHAGQKTFHQTETDKLTLFIIQTMCPFSTVESQAFRDLLKVLDPRYVPPCRTTFSTKLIPQLYEEKKSVLMLYLNNNMLQPDSETLYPAVTHDCWTSLLRESYGTMTVHVIGFDWSLHSFVLSTHKMNTSHAGANLADDMQSTVCDWGIQDPIAVSDNAAMKLLGWLYLDCWDHDANLGDKAALGIESVWKVVSKVIVLVTYLHHSTIATIVLGENAEFQLLREHDKLKPIINVATMWNSSLDILERYQILLPAIHAAGHDEESGLQ